MSIKIPAEIINARVEALRSEMQKRGISIYVVPTSDDHASEYVGEHYKSRSFITGFTGSAGTAVITMEEAGVWADGRYFVQAAHQVEGSVVKLFKMLEPGVPTVQEYVEAHLPEGGCIGFDGSCMVAEQAEKYGEIASKVRGRVAMDEDLIGLIWENRPALPKEPIWILQKQYSGEDAPDKLRRIREKMAEKGAAHHLIASMYDIAWILNLRGNDISHVPVFLSFLYIGQERTVLYAFGEQCTQAVLTYLQEISVELHPYDGIYEELPELLQDGQSVLLDRETVNARLLAQIPENITVVDDSNPSEWMRAVKNDTEIANTIEAHIRDGVAVTRFIHFLKTRIGQEEMTELSADQVLTAFRREQPDFLDISFDTIAAYGANAAMMHYSATPEDHASLAPEGMLLVDSGGHYLQGTTDITRTIVLGYISEEVRKMYTTVLKSHLRLEYAKFPKGVTGQNLDAIAREPMWALGLDYRCGTGHGVGHILNVHEGPNSFRWRSLTDKPAQPLEPGMITTDEPGYYEEGAYGIRIENELLCVADETTEYGEFLKLIPITYAPIDLDAVLPEMLSAEEREWLNCYHALVFEKISPYLDEEEKEWLKYETRAI
jgi:Xaa-Pro aminopeptidase